MWLIKSVKIDNFWGKYEALASLNTDVTILIGDNGSGKTSYMNLLNASLSVDVYKLSELDFKSIKIKILDGGSKKEKTITISKEKDDDAIIYKLGNKTFSKIPILFRQEHSRFYPTAHRRLTIQIVNSTKKELEKYISLSSLSVYRNPTMRIEHDKRELFGDNENSSNPVEVRLNKLIEGLALYQLELSKKGEEISAYFQKQVLESFLVNSSTSSGQKRNIKFESFPTEASKIEYRTKRVEELRVAYTELKCPNANFQYHIEQYISACENMNDKFLGTTNHDELIRYIQTIEADQTVTKIVEFGKTSKTQKDRLFLPLNRLLGKIQDFITNKVFELSEATGAFVVKNEHQETIDLADLSSGEKQLLILLIETTLQRNSPTFFLADEPELSLHISWQQKIISAVLELNTNAQILVATHSPEIAGQFPDKIIDMKDILNA